MALGVVAAFLGWLVFAVGHRTEVDGEALGFSAAEEASAIRVVTDEEDLELELAPALEVEAVEATRTVEPGDFDAPPGSAATTIPSPSPDSAPVRGLLRDSTTGEPLPVYALRIQDSSGRWEDVMTDESGRFATGSPMVGGTIRITPFDEPSHRRSLPGIAVERSIDDGEARDLDLSVPCGPTYRLAISPVDAVVSTTFSAILLIRNQDDRRSLGPEPLRAGDPPWVRFAPVPKDFDRCDRIEIRDKGGIWLGSAKVSALAGIVPGLVDLVLDARAVLLGKAVDREGRPVRGAGIVFEGVAASGKAYERKASTRVDGEFRIEYLLAGSGAVSVRSLRHIGQDAAIRLPAGAVTRQDFILAPWPAAGAIRGRVESETGSYEAEVEVVLRPLSGTANSETKKVSWEERSGRRMGVFEFGALPAGEYELTPRDGGWFVWEPLTLLASPPSEVARFLVHDDLAHADFAFRTRDAETGANLDAVFAWWNVRGGQGGQGGQGGSTGSKKVPSGERFLTRFPLGRSIRWRLDRAGYRPAFGDEKAFAVEELHEGGVWRIAEVELAPGWGEVFRVVGRGQKKPIEGAKILLDGREAGTTNKDGRCTALARERPQRVEVVYRDWQIVSPVDLRPAWKRKDKRSVEIQVAPPPKN